MNGLKRTLASLAVVWGLTVATPIGVLADPGTVSVDDTTVDVTISDTTLTTSGTTIGSTDTSATITTTGTTIGASVPATTVTVLGDAGQPGTPGLTVTPGAGAVTSNTTATPSGSGFTRDGTAEVLGGSALLLVTELWTLDQAAMVTAGIHEPMTGSTVDVQAQAHALLCLVATARVDPTQALLDAMCAGDASTGDGAATLAVSNTLTGTTVSSGAVLRAAICLIAIASSPLPDGTGSDDALTLARASLTTLCGMSPSTATGESGLTASNEATGTTISTTAAIDAAICLLANGVLGDPTTLQLATTCGLADDAAPTTADATAAADVRDGTTGTDASLAPTLEAAICVLANAMGQLSDADDATVTADIATACSDGPSDGSATTPAGVQNDITGTDAELVPAVDAAICILATAQAGPSGLAADVTDLCDAQAPSDTTRSTTATAEATTPGGIQAPGGPSDGADGGLPDETTAPGGTVLGIQLSGLPSTSTAVGGMALAALAAFALLAASRRSRRRKDR